MTNKKIKVIKKKDLNAKPVKQKDAGNSSPATPRQMVSNVSAWVNEFQKRKREETKHAFDTLVAKQPQNAS